jgi:cytidylate kinase
MNESGSALKGNALVARATGLSSAANWMLGMATVAPSLPAPVGNAAERTAANDGKTDAFSGGRNLSTKGKASLTYGTAASTVGAVTSRVVCISSADGAGGEQVGRLVAERLGFVYVDEEIVSRTAAKAGLDAGSVADEERRKSLVSRMLQALAQSGAEALAAGAPPPRSDETPTGETVRVLIRETIEQTAARGNVVIVAHAASHALPLGPETLRVFVTASPQIRAQRLGESERLDTAGAARAVKDSDAARRDYLRRFYDVEELPTHYDLVVNTDFLSFEQAAGLVATAASG